MATGVQLDLELLDKLSLSLEAKDYLKRFLPRFTRRFRDDLISVLVTGDAPSGDWDEGTSKTEVLVVVEKIDYDVLDDVAKMTVEANKRVGFWPIVKTPRELTGGADVFCGRYASMKRDYVCLGGPDLLRHLEVDDEHLPFVTEYELRSLQGELRTLVLQDWGQTSAESDKLRDIFHRAIVPLEGLVDLFGYEVPSERGEVFERVGEILDTDVAVLGKLRFVHRSGHRLSQSEIDDLAGGLDAILGRCIERLSALEEDDEE